LRRRTTVSDIRQSKSTHSEETVSRSESQALLSISYNNGNNCDDVEEENWRVTKDGDNNNGYNNNVNRYLQVCAEEEEGKSRSDSINSLSTTANNTPWPTDGGKLFYRSDASERNHEEEEGKSRSNSTTTACSPFPVDSKSNSVSIPMMMSPHSETMNTISSNNAVDNPPMSNVRIEIPISPHNNAHVRDIQSDSSRRENVASTATTVLGIPASIDTTTTTTTTTMMTMATTMAIDHGETGGAVIVKESSSNRESRHSNPNSPSISPHHSSSEVPLPIANSTSSHSEQQQQQQQQQQQHHHSVIARETSGGRRQSKGGGPKLSPRSLPLPLTPFSSSGMYCCRF
jgi:hypothetical protein